MISWWDDTCRAKDFTYIVSLLISVTEKDGKWKEFASHYKNVSGWLDIW